MVLRKTTRHRNRRSHYNYRLYPDGRLSNGKTVPENRSYWNLWNCHRNLQNQIQSRHRLFLHLLHNHRL